MKTGMVILHWIPRVLCLLAIGFISLFALDAFGHGNSIWEQIGDFIIHLIPTFILIIFLLYAWKKELYGGIIFTFIGLILSPFLYSHNYSMNNSVSMSLGIVATITLPFIIVGALFILSHFLKKSQNNS